MTLSEDKIGDKGYRYEIRYVRTDGKDLQMGTAVKKETADKMASTFLKAPYVKSTRVIDRGDKGRVVPDGMAQCLGCGCHDDMACIDQKGKPCYWAVVDRIKQLGICSECKDRYGEIKLEKHLDKADG